MLPPAVRLLPVLVVLALLLWAAWLLMRRVARLPVGWQLTIAALLLVPILLELIECCTGYALTSPWAPLCVFLLAVVAWPLAMFLLWHKSRIAAGAGLALAAVLLFLDYQPAVVLFVVVLGTQQITPIGQGRISPTASYRIVLRHSLWGATPFYAYAIFKNPRWLPLFQKEVTNAPVPCGGGSLPDDVVIAPGPGPDVAQISCRNPADAVAPVQVRLR